MKTVFVAIMMVFGVIGCTTVPTRTITPVLAPVGPVDAIRVQFVGAGYESSDMWVCGHGDLIGSPDYKLSCIPYAVFMNGLEKTP